MFRLVVSTESCAIYTKENFLQKKLVHRLVKIPRVEKMPKHSITSNLGNLVQLFALLNPRVKAGLGTMKMPAVMP